MKHTVIQKQNTRNTYINQSETKTLIPLGLYYKRDYLCGIDCIEKLLVAHLVKKLLPFMKPRVVYCFYKSPQV
jgi:hypothetical protein